MFWDVFFWLFRGKRPFAGLSSLLCVGKKVPAVKLSLNIPRLSAFISYHTGPTMVAHSLFTINTKMEENGFVNIKIYKN